MSKKVIDISVWQGEPDFETVKNHVDGVIVRAGYGQNTMDKQFERNISECNRLGIPVGVYWFSYAKSPEEAKKEALYCLTLIQPYKIDLFVAFDFEYDSVKRAEQYGVNVTKALATEMCHAFCSTVRERGYTAVNYTNRDFLSRYYDDTTLEYGLWLAEWPKTPPAPDAKPPLYCVMWQWGVGRVPGINADVDMNILYKEDFIDNTPSNWAAEAVEWAQSNGLLKGDENGDLMLHKNATREEVLVFLWRMKNLLQEQEE